MARRAGGARRCPDGASDEEDDEDDEQPVAPPLLQHHVGDEGEELAHLADALGLLAVVDQAGRECTRCHGEVRGED